MENAGRYPISLKRVFIIFSAVARAFRLVRWSNARQNHDAQYASIKNLTKPESHSVTVRDDRYTNETI